MHVVNALETKLKWHSSYDLCISRKSHASVEIRAIPTFSTGKIKMLSFDQLVLRLVS